MAVCGKSEPDPFYETEPCVLVEVLSPNTKDPDLREKLVAYKSLPSVQTYLIVAAERLAVGGCGLNPTGAGSKRT